MTDRYPLRIDCPACGRPVLVVLSRCRVSDAVPLAFDPEPGASEHHNTILAEDLSHASGTTDSAVMLAGWRGRFTLYRAHFWTCPERMGLPIGRKPSGGNDPAGIRIGGYWWREG